MNLLKEFQEYIKQHHLFKPKDKLLLAVSGGVDSAVLCELCKQAGYDFAIAHCNFQLRGEDSNRDDKFVAQLAKKYDAAFYSTIFNTNAIAKKEKKTVEEAARDLRYAWFATIRNENDYRCIITAHHADDNIETVLMNFFRGTGIKGLHGILPTQNKIVRPLLFANKKDLNVFAAENKLEFVTDYTNEENEYTRNYFRNELIPSIKKFFPGAEDNILKNITRLGEAEKLYDQAVDLHKKKLVQQKENEIHIPVLKLQMATPLSTIIYEIIKEYNFTAHQTEEIISLLQSDSGKYIRSSSHRIIKNRKWLIITPNKTTAAQNILIEEHDKKITFAIGVLQIEKMIRPVNYQLSADNQIAQLDSSEIKFPLLLRRWKQGDYFYPLGMQKKKKLSRFFIDQKLSLTQKENIWVIESNKKILWAIGMRIDNRFKIINSTKDILQITFKMKGA